LITKLALAGLKSDACGRLGKVDEFSDGATRADKGSLCCISPFGKGTVGHLRVFALSLALGHKARRPLVSTCLVSQLAFTAAAYPSISIVVKIIELDHKSERRAHKEARR